MFAIHRLLAWIIIGFFSLFNFLSSSPSLVFVNFIFWAIDSWACDEILTGDLVSRRNIYSFRILVHEFNIFIKNGFYFLFHFIQLLGVDMFSKEAWMLHLCSKGYWLVLMFINYCFLDSSYWTYRRSHGLNSVCRLIIKALPIIGFHKVQDLII